MNQLPECAKTRDFSRQITMCNCGLKSFNDFSFPHFSQVMPTSVARKNSWFFLVKSQSAVLDSSYLFNDFSFHHFSQVMPTLEAFMLSKNPDFRLQKFHLPHFVYGDVTSKGEGILVLEDVSIKGKNLWIRGLLKELVSVCLLHYVNRCPKLFVVVITAHE